MFDVYHRSSKQHGFLQHSRRIKPLDLIFLTAAFVMGISFGSYYLGGHQEPTITPQYLAMVSNKDLECDGKVTEAIIEAQHDRDGEWDVIVSMNKKELARVQKEFNQAKKELGEAKNEMMNNMIRKDALVDDCLPGATRRRDEEEEGKDNKQQAAVAVAAAMGDGKMTSKGKEEVVDDCPSLYSIQTQTGYHAIGTLNASAVRHQFFDHMVPFTHPEKALLVANSITKNIRQPWVQGRELSMEDTDTCTSINIIMTGNKPGSCHILVPLLDRDQIPRTVYVYNQVDPLTGTTPGGAPVVLGAQPGQGEGGKKEPVKWYPYPKSSREATQNPTHDQRRMHEKYLKALFDNLEDMEKQVTLVLEKMAAANIKRGVGQAAGANKEKEAGGDPNARPRTRRNEPQPHPGLPHVKVMILNAGNIHIFINMMCSVERAGLDLKNDLLIFVADEIAEDALERLGYYTFRHKAFGQLPQDEHFAYGDLKFLQMMWLKALSGWLINRLGYELLYLDSDLIYSKDPMELFQDPSVDIFFQDDGARSGRFSPYFGNSGFFYMRSNPKTQHLMQMLLFSWEVILSYKSHQAILSYLLEDHYNRNAISVKIIPLELIPTGKVFHHRKEMMAEIVTGKRETYAFHMNWALNNSDKLKYFKDLGYWFVSEQCADKTNGGLDPSIQSVHQCCVEPGPPVWPYNGEAEPVIIEDDVEEGEGEASAAATATKKAA